MNTPQLTAFGLFAVTAMIVCYVLESRSHWDTVGFAAACLFGSIYGFLQGAWPFGVAEAFWSLIAFDSGENYEGQMPRNPIDQRPRSERRLP